MLFRSLRTLSFKGEDLFPCLELIAQQGFNVNSPPLGFGGCGVVLPLHSAGSGFKRRLVLKLLPKTSTALQELGVTYIAAKASNPFSIKLACGKHSSSGLGCINLGSCDYYALFLERAMHDLASIVRSTKLDARS